MRLLTCAALLLTLVALPARAQVRDGDRSSRNWCEDARGDRERGWFCEVREQSFPLPAGELTVDAGPNGGIRVIGSDRADVRLRAMVAARADDDADARAMAQQVQVQVAGDRVSASGPERDRDRDRAESWSVSYELEVPRQAQLALHTVNGGIGVDAVSGTLHLDAHNGGLRLSDVGGRVRGRTRNGGVRVQLSGARYDGEGLDLETTNGGVHLTVPERYSADLETRTVNGRVRVDFPVTVQGRIGRELRTRLGDGGALIRVVTTNGGVSIERR